MAKGRVALSAQGALPPLAQGAIGLVSTLFGPAGLVGSAIDWPVFDGAALLLALAQCGAGAGGAPPTQPALSRAEPIIDFSADEVAYDTNADVVTAEGQVRMARDGNYLQPTASAGTARAAGSSPRAMSWSTPEGDKLIGDRVDLTDTSRDGTIENLLIVLESGGRIAADAARAGRSDRTGQCRLFRLPGNHPGRLSAEPELEDQLPG